VVMEHASRRMLHVNVTAHPSAAWTLQQMREAIPSDHSYRFVIHDRDAIFSTEFDASVAHLGLAVIRTPVRSPKANALCEKLIGTLRRECLDWIIPLTRGASAKNSAVMVSPLQSWSATLLPGASHSRPTAKLTHSHAAPAPSLRPTRPYCRARRSQRTSPRVQPLRSRCLTGAEYLRSTGKVLCDPPSQPFSA
jgi:hypothetical protein